MCRNSFHGRTYQQYLASGKSKLTDGFEPVLNGFKQVNFNDSKELLKKIDKEILVL